MKSEIIWIYNQNLRLQSIHDSVSVLLAPVCMRMWNQSIKTILYISSDQWDASMVVIWPIRGQNRVSDYPCDQSGGSERCVCVFELLLAVAFHGLDFPNNNSIIGQQQQQSGSPRLGPVNIKARGKTIALVYWLEEEWSESTAHF